MSPINTKPNVQAADTPRLFGPSIEVPAVVADQIPFDDVCDLIAAAGPLTLRDVAGGLAVPAARAAGCVSKMIAECLLEEDEFGRYQLAGACAMR